MKKENGTLALKRERDTLLHSDILESANISTLMFERRWQKISSVLSTLADEIEHPDFKQELVDFMEETKRSDPQFVEIYETLKEWCHFNEELREKVEALARSVEEMKGEDLVNFERYASLSMKITLTISGNIISYHPAYFIKHRHKHYECP